MAKTPSTHYVKSDGANIAYQVIGEGPADLLFVPGFVSNVETIWQSPEQGEFFRRIASFCRLILFDKRGTGMSDRNSQIFTLEQRMHDVQAILDAVGSKRATLFGISEGGPMSLLYAATYPKRTSSLVLYGAYAKRSWAPDYPFGWKDEQWQTVLDDIEHHWGKLQLLGYLRSRRTIRRSSPVGDPDTAERVASYYNATASRAAAAAILKMNREIDVRNVLPAIRVPTLILHRHAERVLDVGHARYMAEHIRGARLVELPGEDHQPWLGDRDSVLNELKKFLTGEHQMQGPERAFATVLFTDIVDAKECAATLGDRTWRELLEAFYAKVREVLRQYRGRDIRTSSEGFLAAFDGPARAIRCAGAIRDSLRALKLEVRCGLHTGECEPLGNDLAEIAVHAGTAIARLAGPAEVLVSQAVRDLVAGSGLAFEERGVHRLMDVPSEWRLYRVA